MTAPYTKTHDGTKLTLHNSQSKNTDAAQNKKYAGYFLYHGLGGENIFTAALCKTADAFINKDASLDRYIQMATEAMETQLPGLFVVISPVYGTRALCSINIQKVMASETEKLDTAVTDNIFNVYEEVRRALGTLYISKFLVAKEGFKITVTPDPVTGVSLIVVSSSDSV